MKEAKYLFKDWWLQKIIKEEYTQQAIDDGTQLEIAKMDLIRQSEKAVLCSVEYESMNGETTVRKERWFPKSALAVFKVPGEVNIYNYLEVFKVAKFYASCYEGKSAKRNIKEEIYKTYYSKEDYDAYKGTIS